MKRILFFLCCLTTLTASFAQKPFSPAPGATQGQRVVILNATAHLGTGEVIASSIIELENGKIKSIDNYPTRKNQDFQNATVIDAAGKHAYPGLIALNSTIGLVEVSAVRATRDRDEVGSLNPNIRSLIAYNTDSHVIPTVRSNGILMAQVVPQGGGMVSGQSSVVQLDAWNWEDAAYKADDGLFLNFPQMQTYSWEEDKMKPNEQYAEQHATLYQLLDEAKAYLATDKPTTTNLKLEALRGLFDKSKRLYVRCYFAKEIIAAVQLANKYGMNLTIVGANDAWQVLDLLKQNNVSVIINRTHQLPNRNDEDVYLPSRLPKILKDAGILYAIATGDGWDAYWDMRNLPFEAGTAAAFGLSKEEALQAITINPARILGIDKTTGTLETGKDATLLISSGDLLDMSNSHIERAFIQGREVDLDNKQKALYKKFMAKYGLPPSNQY